MNLIKKGQTMRNLSFINKLVLLLVIVCFTNTCNKEDTALTYNITGNWIVISYEDYENSTIITKTDDNTWKGWNNGDVTIRFKKKDSVRGTINGIKVTNTFTGNYLIGPDGEITISNFNQTKMNEPEWGFLFDAITVAETYEVRDGLLRIYYNHGKNSIILKRIKT